MSITNLNNVQAILGVDTTDVEKSSLISALIPLVEDDYLSIRNKPFGIDSDGQTIYPAGSEMTAIKMIAHLMSGIENNNLGGGVKAESISRYSVTYGTDGDGYPADIRKMIKRFVEFR